MATFVLVGGAWLGGWAWDEVTNKLRRAGHEVYPVTLTGLGERADEATPEVGLETHIADIVTVIETNDLNNVVLVGHSYGGVPVTGASDRVAERIGRVVYVDSGPIPDGLAYIELDPSIRDFIERKVVAEGDGWLLPPLSWDELETELGAGLSGIAPEMLAAARARMTPQPFKTYTEPLRLTNPERESLPKVAILCSFPEAAVRGLIASGHPIGTMMAGPEWRFVELLTSHWPMWSRPDELAAVLDEAVTEQA
ncbi:MAG: alpha/beta fold hydrolase [Chloroflexota bacterium]|nr:alpha/beta fold hydrolase [Chloroflexota bacterium]